MRRTTTPHASWDAPEPPYRHVRGLRVETGEPLLQRGTAHHRVAGHDPCDYFTEADSDVLTAVGIPFGAVTVSVAAVVFTAALGAV